MLIGLKNISRILFWKYCALDNQVNAGGAERADRTDSESQSYSRWPDDLGDHNPL